MADMTPDLLARIIASAERDLARTSMVILTRGQWQAVLSVIDPPSELERIRADLEADA